MAKKLATKTELEWTIDRAEIALFWLRELSKAKTVDARAHAYNRGGDALASAVGHFKDVPKPVGD